jgi:hypothetical protein
MNDRVKPFVPDSIRIWNCSACGSVLGVVHPHGVQIRHKGLIVDASFPIIRRCHKCRTFNLCAGTDESLTMLSEYATLAEYHLQTHLRASG